MPVPTDITQLDTNEANNSPGGTEQAKGNIDNYLRTAFAFIKQIYNTKADITAVQSSSTTVVTAGGTADEITGSFTPAITSLTNGLTLLVRATSPNTIAAPTFKADGTAAKVIAKANGLSLVAGDIAGGGHWLALTFDSALDKWILQNPSTGVQTAPAGKVDHFAMSTAPVGWLKANGALVSRTTYSALFAAIGTTFGAGDGSTTFALPDLRGEFLRGWDDARGADPGRTFGSAQSGQNASHTHGITDPGHSHPNGDSNIENFIGGSNGAFVRLNVQPPNNTGSATTGITIQSSGGTEARPRNVALLACIKY